jgi:hypothetical protein
MLTSACLELVGVRLDEAALAVCVYDNLDARADNGRHHVRDRADALGYVEHLGFEGLAAGESEELARELRGPVHGVGDRIDVALAALLRERWPAQEVGRGADDGEQVVEVVCDAPRELADRFHLLRLTKRGLGLQQLRGALSDALLQGLIEPVQRFCRRPPLADVPQDCGHEHAGVAQPTRGGQLKVAHGTVLAPCHNLDGPLKGLAREHRAPEVGPNRTLGEEQRDRVTNELLCLVAKVLHGGPIGELNQPLIVQR